MTCSEVIQEANARIKIIRDNMKTGHDVTVSLPTLESLVESRSDCITWSSLRLSDQEVASFRKYNYAPDRSKDLPPDKCSSLDIDTSNMPNNNHQSDLQWCYAYTAADLLSFHEKKKLSSYDMAAQYVNSNGANALAEKSFKKQKISAPYSNLDHTEVGGNPYLVFEAVFQSKKGVCSESNIAPTDNDWKRFGKSLKIFAQKYPECYAHDFTQDISNLGHNIQRALDNLPVGKKIEAYFDMTCSGRHQLTKKYFPLSVGKPNHHGSSMLNLLDKLLERGEPASIGYSANLLVAGVNYKGRGADHGSTIIGRRFNKKSGQCEYLIKNSWGTDLCQAGGSIECVNGNFWVPRTALGNNIEFVQWLEAK